MWTKMALVIGCSNLARCVSAQTFVGVRALVLLIFDNEISSTMLLPATNVLTTDTELIKYY